MKYQVKNIPQLRRILWVDFAMGATMGILGVSLCGPMAALLGFPYQFLFWVAIVNLIYCSVALRLAAVPKINVPLFCGLVIANWAWTLLSVYFLYLHYGEATVLGKIFLILQILLVGGLAWIETRQLEKS